VAQKKSYAHTDFKKLERTLLTVAIDWSQSRQDTTAMDLSQAKEDTHSSNWLITIKRRVRATNDD